MVRALILLVALFTDSPAMAESMFRCDGDIPLFTNKGDRGCPSYEPRGRVERARPGATWDDIRAMFPDPPEPPTVGKSEQPAICAIYAEWLDLNTRTHGGTLNQSTQDRQRWHDLSRIFSLITIPTTCH